jgi:putative DNA primase/helicase
VAESFAKEPPAEAVKKYPELALTQPSRPWKKRSRADGLDEIQRAMLSARVREHVAHSIERGEIPNTKIREEK